MFNITTLITIIAVSLSLGSLKPAHLQEYDFIDDMPITEVIANRMEYDNDESRFGMMPIVEITASRMVSNSASSGDIPEITVTASRHHNPDIKPYYGMMSEVLITAERYHRAQDGFWLGQISENNLQQKMPNSHHYSRNDALKLALLFTILSVVGFVINKQKVLTAIKD
jgi:hypothetical protein